MAPFEIRNGVLVGQQQAHCNSLQQLALCMAYESCAIIKIYSAVLNSSMIPGNFPSLRLDPQAKLTCTSELQTCLRSVTSTEVTEWYPLHRIGLV